MHIGVTLPNHRGIDEVDAVVAIGSLAAIKRLYEYATAIGRAHIDRAFSVRVQVQFDEDLGPGVAPRTSSRPTISAWPRTG
jgi:hypothetical protein